MPSSAASAAVTLARSVSSRPSWSITSTCERWGKAVRNVVRKPISRSSSPRNELLLRITITLPGSPPSHSPTR